MDNGAHCYSRANFSSLSISNRSSYLFFSTIIGFARVVINTEILLKEIPLFRSDKEIMVQLAVNQVAMCPETVDVEMLNRVIWLLREVIEAAIVEEWQRQRNETMN